MFKSVSKIVLFGLLFVGIMTSCGRDECEDPIPSLAFANFYADPLDTNEFQLVFSFSDCNGDIGMDANASIVDENGEVQSTNFKLDMYYMENGEWFKYEYASPEGINSTIPVLFEEDEVQSEIIDGEVQKDLHRDFSLGGKDTIYFVARILDNAGHYSNEVQTDAFAIN